MKKMHSLFTVLALFIIVACGDDNPIDNSGNKNYMPLNSGNYWLYNTNDVDTLGNVVNDSTFKDSSAVTGAEVKDGKNATVITNFRFNNNAWVETSKQHIFNENNKTYMHSDFLTKMDFMGVELDMGIQGQWLVYIDNSTDSWTLLNNAPTDTVDLNLGGIMAKVAGTLTITARKLGNENISAAGTNYNAAKFEYKALLSGTALYQGFPIPVSTTITRTYWFADGVGPVKQRTEPSTFNATIMSTKIPGLESILTKVNVSAN